MLLRLEHIQRDYQKKSVHTVALHDVSLNVAAGEFLAIMGPSGSGKSTLLHIVGCLDSPSHGAYRLNNIDISTCDDAQLSAIRNQNIGFIFQAFHLLPQHTVLQNIAAPLLYTYPAPSAERAGQLAQQVGLGERLQHRPFELSGGEMQRVAIARALVTNPRVILADEPTGNLDSRTGDDIMRLLCGLHEQGHTLIIVTHEREIADYADRIIFLKDGTIEREEHKNSPPVLFRVKPNTVDLSLEAPTPELTPQPPLLQREGENTEISASLLLPPNFAGKPDLRKGENTEISASLLLPLSLQERGPGGEFFRFSISSLLPTALTAIHGIFLHKLRSFLSVLGIVFGIGAIIAMMAIGAGARQELLDQIGLLGITNVTIRAIPPADDAVKSGEAQLSQGVAYHDVERLSRGVPHLVALAAVRTVSAQVYYQQHNAQARIVGTEPDYLRSANLTLQSGRFLTPADVESAHRVCILGDDVRQAVFAFQNPLGEMVKIGDNWFRVVGVLTNKKLHPEKLPAIRIHNVNTDVYIPLSTSQVFVGPQEMHALQEISLQIDSPDNMEQVVRIIRAILAREHYGADDYDVIVPRELLQQSQQTQQVFNLVMGSIAGISLLVGGIGIMNIMLATVTERTREIGIRRAIGANRRMILLQFLVETILLTFAGGAIGILLGIGGAAGISIFAGWRTIISWQTIALAFGISALIGLVFGLYPASHGADMNPISALRYE